LSALHTRNLKYCSGEILPIVIGEISPIVIGEISPDTYFKITFFKLQNLFGTCSFSRGFGTAKPAG
jgi:hypothetical protein